VKLATAGIRIATLKVRWERSSIDGLDILEPGPVGEYLQVVDYDPATGCFYAPIDLNDPYALAQDGLTPSEGNPMFHQQMVYAVAMKTIQNFEHALGRVALWSPRHQVDGQYKDEYVPRLRIYPHAMREPNAFYNPELKALLFGYFPASLTDPGDNLPGGMVFTCLSHDIIAHETTHALLDGVHRRFTEDSNPDVLAFHEAFADITALLQHFTFPEALLHQIAKTRGDLGRQNLLSELAQQFGQAIGQYGALRDAIGRVNPQTQQWEPHQPDPAEYQKITEPHARGSILVAALFEAFLSIYKLRVSDLIRIATSGTGVLPEGDIHPDLVSRLAHEAAKSAQHLLTMCIRALDYSPPVDLTFGDYLRALITADSDLVPDDDLGYRLAVIDAFRRRGLYPRDARSMAEDSLRWSAPRFDELKGLSELLGQLKLAWDQRTDRRTVFQTEKENCIKVHAWLASNPIDDAAASELGIALSSPLPQGLTTTKDGKPAVEVHSVRPVRRVGPDGQLMIDLVIELTQQRKVDPPDPELGSFVFRGGCTMLVDLETRQPRYVIRKDIRGETRLQRERVYRGPGRQTSLYATYFGDPHATSFGNMFAALHRNF
jgi:hypothetical protein